MEILKKLPLAYAGELHEVKLINFSVDPEELHDWVPEPLAPKLMAGRACISLVNVAVKRMRPTALPASAGFDYQHVGFRLLVDDSEVHHGPARGLFFLQSFGDKAWISRASGWLTNYRLTTATIKDEGYAFELRKGERYFHYALDDLPGEEENPEFTRLLKRLDRAYAVMNEEVWMTRIRRKKWPVVPATCYHLDTNFFTTARLLNAYRVVEAVPYRWDAPRPVWWPSAMPALARA